MKQIHLFSLQRYIFLFIQQEMKQKIMLFTSRNEVNNIFIHCILKSKNPDLTKKR